MQNTEQDLLADLEVNLQQAGTGKRLANYLIDVITFYIVVLVAGVLLMPSNMSVSETAHIFEGFLGTIIDRLLASLLYGLYMFFVEALFKGKSLGKLITGTRAVNGDGSPITVKTAFLRGLSRAVPFEVFSAFGNPSYPWHDRWTRTYVIDEKLSMTRTEI